MIYRNRIQNNNSKQSGGFSPIISPRSKKKTVNNLINNAKLSPKSSNRLNKQNKQNKQEKSSKSHLKTDENYFKIPKQGHIFQMKTSKPKKPLMTITIDENGQNMNKFKQINNSNIQTPKFKCSQNKIDGVFQQQFNKNQQNYFSFGDEFRKNISNKFQQQKLFKQKPQKRALMEKFKPAQQQQKLNQKLSYSPFKKKDKIEKLKQSEHKLQKRFFKFQGKTIENKIKKNEDYFCFRK